MRPLDFLVNSLRPALLPLWALFTYYLLVVPRVASTRTSPAPPARIWITALWVSGVVGTALNVNGYVASNASSPRLYLQRSPFGVIRFFLIPFCVSSYSGVASWAGESAFWFIFPSEGAVLGVAAGVACVPVACGLALHWARRRWGARPAGAAASSPGSSGSQCTGEGGAGGGPSLELDPEAVALEEAGGPGPGPPSFHGPGPGPVLLRGHRPHA